MVFVNLKQAYGRVQRELIWWMMREKSTFNGYVNNVKDAFSRAMTPLQSTYGRDLGILRQMVLGFDFLSFDARNRYTKY